MDIPKKNYETNADIKSVFVSFFFFGKSRRWAHAASRFSFSTKVDHPCGAAAKRRQLIIFVTRSKSANAGDGSELGSVRPVTAPYRLHKPPAWHGHSQGIERTVVSESCLVVVGRDKWEAWVRCVELTTATGPSSAQWGSCQTSWALQGQ